VFSFHFVTGTFTRSSPMGCHSCYNLCGTWFRWTIVTGMTKRTLGLRNVHRTSARYPQLTKREVVAVTVLSSDSPAKMPEKSLPHR
jgi:hypothetical protein